MRVSLPCLLGCVLLAIGCQYYGNSGPQPDCPTLIGAPADCPFQYILPQGADGCPELSCLAQACDTNKVPSSTCEPDMSTCEVPALPLVSPDRR